MTETKIHHTDSEAFKKVAQELISAGFTMNSMVPPPLCVEIYTDDELAALSKAVREVVLTEKYKLIKEYTPHDPCGFCAWYRMHDAVSDSLADDDYSTFSCKGMACVEDVVALPQQAYFTLVRIDLPKKETTYEEDKFDFSDWGGIRRASGF